MSICSRMWEKREVKIEPGGTGTLSVVLLLAASVVAAAQDRLATAQQPATQPAPATRFPARRPAHRRRRPQLKAPRRCGSWWASRCSSTPPSG